MNRKRATSGFVMVLLLLALGRIAGRSTGDPPGGAGRESDTVTVFVCPEDSCLSQGDTVVVGVCVDSMARALKVYSIRMIWDPSILEFQRCDEDTLLAQGGPTFFWSGLFGSGISIPTSKA